MGSKEMKKQWIFHPLLFALYPALELYFNLSAEVPFAQTWRALPLIVILVGLLWFLLSRYLRDVQRAALVTTALVAAFLFYGFVYRALWSLSVGDFRVGRHLILFPLWLAFWGFMASPGAWRRIRDPQWLTTLLNAVAAFALLISVGRFAFNAIRRQMVESTVASTPALLNAHEVVPLNWEGGTLPDIYYIIVDGYGRADMLQELYAFDNGDFLRFLAEQGFYVAASSQSNYVQTALSLASSLNMRYLEGYPPLSEDRGALIQLIQNSQLYRSLASLGYQLVTVDTGYAPTRITSASVFLAPTAHQGGLNSYETMLFLSSAGVVLSDAGWITFPSFGYGMHQTLTRYTFKALAQIPSLPGPKLVFIHVMSPHPPFVFDREGNPVTPDSPYVGGLDGSFFFGSVADYQHGYLEQLQFINTLLRDTLPVLQVNSAVSPIIVLQADHGPGAFLNWDSVERTCLWERTAILNAYYLPEGGDASLHSTITPVNSFRVVLDTYFGADLGLLEDWSYFSTWEQPYHFFPVTKLDSAVCHP